MQSRISAVDAGLMGSIFMISIHLLWCVLVFFGVAQIVIDYILWLHFVKPVFQIEKFDMYVAIYLLALVSCVGFLGGYITAKIFNLLSINGNND